MISRAATALGWSAASPTGWRTESGNGTHAYAATIEQADAARIERRRVHHPASCTDPIAYAVPITRAGTTTRL